jgi:4-hydroxy-tetrahydrodipicolinate synthase
VKTRPTGVIAPMTTPFRKDGEIDLNLVAPQVDWLIGAGSHGMAAGGSTGEGHTLDHEEYRDLMAATVDAAKGRAPVIAGIIVDSTRDAIKRGKLVRDMAGVAALQVTPVHYTICSSRTRRRWSAISAAWRTKPACPSSSTTSCHGPISRRRCSRAS